MFFIVVLGVWTLMHVYVFWRAASVPLIANHVHRGALIAIALFLWSSFLLGRLLEHYGVPLISRALAVVGANWMGVLFLCLVTTLIADVVTGFGFLIPEAAPVVRGWALLLACALSVFAVVQGVRAPSVESYEVGVKGLPAERDGTVVVVASDMHVGEVQGKGWLEARVKQIEAEKPDLIVLAGDIVEGEGETLRDLVPVMSQFRAPLGVWAVTGNHEFYNGYQNSVRTLRDSGIRVLVDEWAEAAPGLVLAGVDDLTARRRRFGRDDGFMEKALAGRPTNAGTIMVSHTPWRADVAANAGAALMVSGHTHNGQIWPFTYAVKAVYPLVEGRYNVNGMTVLVCRGTGTWGPRMRLWQRGAIMRITLRAA